ncbi:MAG: hypothetical protein JWP69_2403 [Flaviaesturariibacter sp.]|nr:hypothetical protein [Flaviaesturariibacter sp.]
MTRRGGVSPLLLAGLAAAGYYAYTKMSPQTKQNLLDKGKKLAGNLPLDNLKNAFSKVTGS